MLRAVAMHELEVGPLPAWMDARRLLGPTSADDPEGRRWSLTPEPSGQLRARARLDTRHAADLAARLRGLGFDGAPLACSVEPPLERRAVRRARSEDAKRRRATTPGFVRGGTRLDAEGRMSLTPEALALRVGAWAGGRPVVDAGCGAGGNAIGFARSGCAVRAIERDAGRLADARHNASRYGVGARIEFVLGDALELAREAPSEDAILFVDPPWGADWDRRACGLEDFPLLAQLRAQARGYAALWAKLPPSFASGQLLEGRAGSVRAVFGEGEGDRRRVKFVLVRVRLP